MALNIRNYPRRPTADNSVSLLHSPRARLQHQQRQQRNSGSSGENARVATGNTSAVAKSDSHSPSSLAPLAGRGSSGESSNAEKWFEKSNNEVTEASKSFADNDPPFFMRNSSSSEEQGDGQHSAGQYTSPNDIATSLQLRTGFLHLGTDASSTEDFRSVIDDLTIENKKLKRRLKKYEKLHDSHLKDEKLFEVRVHGLSADKKRELEETLRKFATELSVARGSTEFPAHGYLKMQPTLATHQTASSSTSLQNTDSAYASMSVSGQGSGGSDAYKHRKTAQLARSRHQNIHSYLHHIPEGFLSQQNPELMSERAKKKLVVRRLEQIFAGKGAALSGHQQALQQQDVSQSAAQADRIEREAQGQLYGKEGIREAKIMNAAKDAMARSSDAEEVSEHVKHSSATVKHAAANLPTNSPDSRALEQRPTRPLDLDPHRAQVPAENLRYFRHLGFPLPDPGAGSPQDDEGWIYLNLLVSMAQLHTVSVTSDFVRKALGDFSDKFELSSDGRKVRWKGGSSVTRTSSNGGGDSSIDQTDDDSNQSPRKRIKTGVDVHGHNAKRSSRHIPGVRSQQSESNRFAYTPLFFHKDSTGDEDSSTSGTEDEDDASSPFPAPVGGDSSGMTSSGIRTTSTRNKRKHDDGPIIFYNNARFCTDLSGDARPAISPGAPIYKAANVAAIGAPESHANEAYFETRGPLAEMVAFPEPMDLADNPIPDSMELSFPTPSPKDEHVVVPQSPIDFEVTGIGGVYPADHFAISVESRHVFVPEARPQRVRSAVKQTKILPPRLVELLSTGKAESTTTSTSHSHRFTSRRQEMPPSTLPPALSYMLTESDSVSDDGSDVDESMSVLPESLGGLPSLAAPQQLDLPYGHSDDSEGDVDGYKDEDEDNDDGNNDAESDGSLDLLAAARELDPEAVRAREREYDANMAERLAEEIPTGSSAATAGGGSGFASPASGVSRAMYLRVKNTVRADRPAFNRRETTDSMANNMQDSSSSGEEDDSRSRS